MSPNTCMTSPALKVSSACHKKRGQIMSTNYYYTLSLKKKKCMCKSDLYVIVGGALTWIIIKDGNHPACSWGHAPHSCICSSCSCSRGGRSLAGFCQSNREGQTVQSDILVIRGATHNSAIPISSSACSSSWLHVRPSQRHAKLRRSHATAVKHGEIKVKTTGN